MAHSTPQTIQSILISEYTFLSLFSYFRITMYYTSFLSISSAAITVKPPPDIPVRNLRQINVKYTFCIDVG